MGYGCFYQKKEAIKKQLLDDVDLFFQYCQRLHIGDYLFLIEEVNEILYLGGNLETKSVNIHVNGDYDKSLQWGQFIRNSNNTIDFITGDKANNKVKNYISFTEELTELVNNNFVIRKEKV